MTDKPRKQWHEVARTLKTLTPDQQRGASGTMAAGQLDDSILLLVRHGDQPPRQYLYGNTDKLQSAGSQVGFKVTALKDGDEPELPENVTAASHPVIPWTARLNKVGNMERMRTDLSEIRKGIEAAMPPDSYVSINLRRRGHYEYNRIRNWVASEHNNPEDEETLVRSGATCARVTAGARDREQADMMAKAIGGAVFSDMSDMSSHPSRPRLGLLAASGAITFLWCLLTVLSPWANPWIAAFAPLTVSFALFIAWAAIALGTKADIAPWAVPAALGAWAWWGLGWLPLPWLGMLAPLPLLAFAIVRYTRASLWDDVEQKPRRYWWLAPHRFASSADNEEEGSKDDDKKKVNAYPTCRSTLLADPATVVALYTPVGDASAVEQMPHPVPALLAKGGVYLGDDQTGRRGYLDPTQLFCGITIFGEAGSGKTNLIHGIIQWADMNRAHTESSYWGWDTRIISFDMKDSNGVRLMHKWRRRNGLDRQWKEHGMNGDLDHAIMLATPNSKGRLPDLLGMSEGRGAKDTAVAIAAGMQYSFEPGAIMADSLDRLTSAFTMGVAATRYELALDREGAGMDDVRRIHQRMRALEPQYPGAVQATPQQSPVGWASVALCAGDGGIGAARAFGETLRGLAVQHPGSRDLDEARKAAENMYGRPKARIADRALMDACRSASTKVGQLLPCEYLFDPKRATLTWRHILSTRGDWHFVLAPYTSVDRETGERHTESLPGKTDRIIGAWLMYRLWNEVTATCQGWREKGKHTMIVCDELSLLANADPKILAQVREQGRSFGAIPVFATQFPQQLVIEGDETLLNSVMGYSTFISYNTANPDMARTVAAIMSDKDDGSDGWTGAAIRNLRKYEIAVRTRTQRQAQPAFLLQAHNFDAD